MEPILRIFSSKRINTRPMKGIKGFINDKKRAKRANQRNRVINGASTNVEIRLKGWNCPRVQNIHGETIACAPRERARIFLNKGNLIHFK